MKIWDTIKQELCDGFHTGMRGMLWAMGIAVAGLCVGSSVFAAGCAWWSLYRMVVSWA